MSICDHNLKVLDNHLSEDGVDTLIQQLLYIYLKKKGCPSQSYYIRTVVLFSIHVYIQSYKLRYNIC